MIMILDSDVDRIKSAKAAAADIESSSTNPVITSWAQKNVWLLNTVLANIARLQTGKPLEDETPVHPV